MKRELRIQKLTELQSDTKKVFGQGFRLVYQGSTKEFKTYKIPLDYLIYNKYNGRIGSRVKSYAKQYHELNAEDTNDIKILEDFLWESAKDRNEKTSKSLSAIQQQKPGIVTSDGVIVDGNRRAMLLNKLRKKEFGTFADYFIAVILPSDADKREIMQLETTYQMGEDEKVTYDAIEKYLKCKDLQENGFSSDKIAEFMSEDKPQIDKMLMTMKVMDEYLESMEYSGIYTALEKREDQFLSLTDWLKRFKKGAALDWNYDETDVSDLKMIAFDYIRAQYEGKEFRRLAQPSKNEPAVFSDENTWRNFVKTHEEKVSSLREKKLEDLVKKSPNIDYSTLIKHRDSEWQQKVDSELKDNLTRSVNRVKKKVDGRKPLAQIEEIRKDLLEIETDVRSFGGKEFYYALKAVKTIIDKWHRLLSKKYD